MNDCADIQAGTGASKAQLPPNVAQAVEALAALATKVHKRLAEIAQVRFDEKRKEFVRWTIFLIFSSIAPKVAQGVACNAISLPAGTSEWLANDFPVSYLIKSSAVYKMPCENMYILHMYASYVWTCT